MEAPGSCRGKRTIKDLQLITSFVRSYIPQVCSYLSDCEFHDLCNEIDWVTICDNDVLFLQNEPADSYYLIGKGSINLYYEEDGYTNASVRQDCSLGTFVGQLLRGQGFGEYALLANSLARSELQKEKHPHKGKGKRKTNNEISFQPAGRSCSAISGSNDTLLFVINEAAYHRIFKKYHHAQRQRAHCIHFLRKLPIFLHASLATVTQVAFKTTKVKLPFKATLGEYDAPINTVSIVLQGAVKVSTRVEATTDSLLLLDDAFHLHLGQSSMASSIMGLSVIDSIASASVVSGVAGSVASVCRPPLPAVAVLRPGEIVGSLELLKGLHTFKFNYEVQSLSAEVLQLPLEVYLQSAREAALRDPQCANRTILRQVAVEFSIASQCEPESHLQEDSSILSSVAAYDQDCVLGTVSEGMNDEPQSTHNDPRTPSTALDAAATPHPHQTAATEPSVGSTITITTSEPPARTVTTGTTPGKRSPAVPSLHSLHSLLASPPAISRPSKVQYRTPRGPRALSVGQRSLNNPTSVLHSKPLPSMISYSPCASHSVVLVPSFVPVFSPAPPISTTAPGSARGINSSTHSATSTSPRRLGAGYVDIVDTLERRYPSAASVTSDSSVSSSGPSGSAAYLASPAEAARAVAREIQAIRQRVHARQKQKELYKHEKNAANGEVDSKNIVFHSVVTD